MATETLHFENARIAQQLFGGDPQNLGQLEQILGVKATSREGWIKLEGTAEDVERAKTLFHLIEGSLREGTAVKSRDFSRAIDVVKAEGVGALRDIYAERIHTSTKKANVSPKTTGQRKYIEAIRKHDVTFGVGPAGTGKTYLAM